MLELQSQPIPEGGTMLNPDQICDLVLGTRSGYIRGLGHGPKPHTSAKSSQRATLDAQEAIRRADEAERVQHELLERVEVQNQKIQSQNQMIESQQTQIEEMRIRQTQFENMFQAYMSSAGHVASPPTSWVSYIYYAFTFLHIGELSLL